MNKDDDLNSEKMVEKCCSCVGWGLRSGTTKRWARPTLTVKHCVVDLVRQSGRQTGNDCDSYALASQ